MSVLLKAFYNADLKILLLELEIILNKMFLFIIIITISVVFRIIIYYTRDSLKQTNDIVATIFIIKSILLFRAFFRIFNAIVKFSARVEIAFIQKTSIVVSFIFLIAFKEL